MFTGIIEEKARIDKITQGAVWRIGIASHLETNKGDSIAIQGVCLTVTNVDRKGFTAEAMRQTKRVTTIPDWRAGDYVNCERALKMGDRIGGHMLLGHVDEVGKMIRKQENVYYFQISRQNARYLIDKGSIGINGVSLTVSTVSSNIFSVSLIPYTLETTTFGILRAGALVNVEYDYLVKILLARQ
jgi:riboflavin synthase